MTDPLAGRKAPVSMLADIPSLIAAYYSLHPDASEPSLRVSFGTSGHRGSALTKSSNEDHVLAIAQAVCDYRKAHKLEGSLFMGKDTYALSAKILG